MTDRYQVFALMEAHKGAFDARADEESRSCFAWPRTLLITGLNPEKSSTRNIPC